MLEAKFLLNKPSLSPDLPRSFIISALQTHGTDVWAHVHQYRRTLADLPTSAVTKTMIPDAPTLSSDRAWSIRSRIEDIVQGLWGAGRAALFGSSVVGAKSSNRFALILLV